MSDLIDTTEMYLRTIFELEEEGIVPAARPDRRAAGSLGPDGLADRRADGARRPAARVGGDRHLELTAAGRAKATRVMRKHRLAERLLLDVIGLEWEYVHEEACRWEHVMSERVERKLLADRWTTRRESPYGNPIPGLDGAGRAGRRRADSGAGVVALPEAGRRRAGATGAWCGGSVSPLQTDPTLMGRLLAAGRPARARVHVRAYRPASAWSTRRRRRASSVQSTDRGARLRGTAGRAASRPRCSVDRCVRPIGAVVSEISTSSIGVTP